MILKLTFSLFLSFAASRALSITNDLAICEHYKTVATELNCSSENYLIQFGYKNCREYVLRDSTYKPHTRLVLSKIRSCLVRDILTDTELTCENAEERAMRSHYDCYIDSGYCEIDPTDQFKIFQVAAPEIHRESFQQTMFEIGSTCIAKKLFKF